MSFPLLRVNNLSVAFSTYGRTSQVLHNVSLDVPARSQVALVGESGSGKTVTMKAIMGLLRQPPARILGGEIYYDGADLLTMPDKERLRLRGTAKERMARVHQVLDQVRMRDPVRISRSYPIELSGGMRQRVLIAMALLSEPQLLIADEPGTALDVTTQAQILKLLKDLVEERGLALLMITHNLGVVRETSNYVYVMNKGVIVEHGETAGIFEAPRDPYTQSLIKAVPRLTGGMRFGEEVAP